jgi:hypothetical protein
MSKTLENFVTEIESPNGLSKPLYANEVMLISREVNENYVALAEKCAEAILASQTANARIAELTTEVSDLTSKLDFANAMNSDQDKTVAGLTAEVQKYRKVLGCIANGKDINAWLANIARNALKDGV